MIREWQLGTYCTSGHVSVLSIGLGVILDLEIVTCHLSSALLPVSILTFYTQPDADLPYIIGR